MHLQSDIQTASLNLTRAIKSEMTRTMRNKLEKRKRERNEKREASHIKTPTTNIYCVHSLDCRFMASLHSLVTNFSLKGKWLYHIYNCAVSSIFLLLVRVSDCTSVPQTQETEDQINTVDLIIKATVRDYLLDESCVATWMVSNVHITIMNGMITWKRQLDGIQNFNHRDILFVEMHVIIFCLLQIMMR